MISAVRCEQYLSLVENFLNGSTEVDPFCEQFTEMWTQDRDEANAKKAGWPEPYDQQIIAAFQRGEMSKYKFKHDYLKLWGHTAEDSQFQRLIDAMFSACGCFRSSPELKWEISEKQLRQEAKDFLARRPRTLPLQAA